MKKLVILGGGAAGFLIAIRVMRSKISDIEVTLVDSKVWFDVCYFHAQLIFLLNVDFF
jgi:NADH dehydrogenase FAD-containing subunit